MAIKKVMIGINEDLLKDIDQKAKTEHRSRSNYIEYTLIAAKQQEEQIKQFKERIFELEGVLKNIPIQQPNKKVNTEEEELMMPMNFPNFIKK